MGIAFYGAVYSKSDTATSDTGRRFETSSKKLTRCVIEVRNHGQNFGQEHLYTSQYVYYTAGSKFELVDVDVSTLFFANATAGANGTVAILGISAD